MRTTTTAATDADVRYDTGWAARGLARRDRPGVRAFAGLAAATVVVLAVDAAAGATPAAPVAVAAAAAAAVPALVSWWRLRVAAAAGRTAARRGADLNAVAAARSPARLRERHAALVALASAPGWQAPRAVRPQTPHSPPAAAAPPLGASVDARRRAVLLGELSGSEPAATPGGAAAGEATRRAATR